MATELAPLEPDALGDVIAALHEELRASDRLSTAVAAESGLHPVAVRASLIDWTEGLTRESLARLVTTASRPPAPATHLLTLAPGNVPIVAAECLLLGLLAGGRHTLALSTRASALAIALRAHARRLEPTLDERLELVVWRHLEPSDRRAALASATRVVAFGTAPTVEQLAEQVPPGVALVPHGPSLAASYLDATALSPSRLEQLADDLALDVARWDQRGCRSPHAVLVAGDLGVARSFAARLASESFPSVAARLPFGRLTDAELAATYLDRLTSASLGEVLVGAAGVVTLEDRPAVLRPSPLGRTLRVVSVEGPSQLEALAATLPAPLGALAVAGTDPNTLLGTTDPLDRVPFGQLQRPAFDRLHDGRHRLDELRDPPS